MQVIKRNRNTVRKKYTVGSKQFKRTHKQTNIFSLMKAALLKRRSFICNYQRLTYHLPTFSTHKPDTGTPFICFKTVQVTFYVAWSGFNWRRINKTVLDWIKPTGGKFLLKFGALQEIQVLRGGANYRNRKWEAKVFEKVYDVMWKPIIFLLNSGVLTIWQKISEIPDGR